MITGFARLVQRMERHPRAAADEGIAEPNRRSPNEDNLQLSWLKIAADHDDQHLARFGKDQIRKMVGISALSIKR
jgi:hypothetical protein